MSSGSRACTPGAFRQAVRELSRWEERTSTAREYSNPPVQQGTTRHVQGRAHAGDLPKAEVTGGYLLIHTEVVAWAALTTRNIRQVTALRPRKADPRWQALFEEQDSLAEHINRWTVGDAVPPGVADVLRVARTLLIDSYYEYDYSLVAVAWGFLVLEACLHGCVPLGGEHREDRRPFGTLVRQAETDGLITRQEATTLLQVVKFRNDIFHRAYMQVKPPPESYSPNTALQMLESIHDAVSDIYGRAVNQLTSQPSKPGLEPPS